MREVVIHNVNTSPYIAFLRMMVQLEYSETYSVGFSNSASGYLSQSNSIQDLKNKFLTVDFYEFLFFLEVWVLDPLRRKIIVVSKCIPHTLVTNNIM